VACGARNIVLAMSIKLTLNGELWEFSTPAEAAEFKRAITEVPSAPSPEPVRRRSRNRTTGRLTSRAATTGARVVRGPVAFSKKAGGSLSPGSRQILEAARRLPPDGLMSDAFAVAIGSPGAMSIPVRMMVLGKELRAIGFKPDEVVQRTKVYMKGRGKSVFKAGPRLDDALRQTGDLFALAK
jgi:hypothetical protein